MMFNEKLTRREMILGGSAALAGVTVLGQARPAAAQPEGEVRRDRPREGSPAAEGTAAPAREPQRPGEPGRDYTPVIAPNAKKLPWKIVDGVKVFHLIAEEVEHELAPGLKATCWGYNGSVHGPVIEAVEGDRVRIFVTNRLAAPTTVHWHGVLLPSGMDGVGGSPSAPSTRARPSSTSSRSTSMAR